MSQSFVGTITNTKGFKGKFYISDVPNGINIVNKGTKVNIGYSSNFTKQYTIEKWDKISTGAVILLQEITSDNLAKDLKENAMFIEENDLKDKENEEYFKDVSNFEVFNVENGEKIGYILEVWELPANNVWLIDTEKGDLPVPVINEVVKSINYNEQKVEIFLIPGLIDLLDNGKGEKQDKDDNEEEIE